IATLGERLLDVDRSDRFWAGMRVEHASHGLYVVSTHPRGPAALAGIQAGDHILKIDQGEVSGISDYAALMLPKQAGDSVKIRIEARTGQVKNIDLKLKPARLRDTMGLLGFDAQRDQVQFRNRTGRRQRLQALRVTKIFPQSGAENLGLEIGDLIVGILISDGKGGEVWEPVRSTSELVSLVRGPTFVLEKDNFWILRGESSFRGRLLFDSPEMKMRN
ncbi:MAG: PDZ domain-containing protein, partial [Planctomycetes bacterium]|nr:PDZ domain-containing protein [Planctomycetota bacterium]